MSEHHSRRQVLKASIAAGICSSRPLFASHADNWDEFLLHLKVAVRHPASAQKVIIQALRHLDLKDRHLSRLVDDANRPQIHPNVVNVGIGETFEVRLVVLNALDIVPLHDHLNLLGIFMCLKGNVRVQRFSFVRMTSEERCLLRVRDEEVLWREQLSAVDPATNLHSIHAVTNTVLLEVFTPRYDSRAPQQPRGFALQDHVGKDEIEAIVI